MRSAGDREGELEALLGMVAGGDLRAVRAAVAALPRETAGELLVMLVLRVASYAMDARAGGGP